jgi:hypothetical protein
VYRADTGAGLLNWWGETTGDTWEADATGLIYESPSLAEPRHVLGMPAVRLRVSTDAPLADWVARLEDVWPDGSVSLVTGGAINGAQRRERTEPEAIVPGETFTLEFPLRFTTWTFEPGHRIRLAIANGQFGMSWPTPYPMMTTLHVGDTSELVLPFVTANDGAPPPLLPPESREQRPDARSLESPADADEIKDVALTPYRLEHDPVTGITTASALESSAWEVAGRQYRTWKTVAHSVKPDDPAHAGFRGEGFYEVALDNRTVTVRTTIRIDSDTQHFHVWERREVAENGEVVREREWRETIARDFQ